jgi:hypothetical protein
VNEHSAPRWLPADERRQLILEAARRAFSRRGDVGRTTIKDIAAEARISEGNIASEPPRADDRLFVSRVIDVAAAILGAPVSAETNRLWAEREKT